MTDTINRQDAVAAIEALSPAGLKPKGVGLVANITIGKAIAAINALPAVTVTDDMVERAGIKYSELRYGETVERKAMKAALLAALGE